jgi:hypothetical protein
MRKMLGCLWVALAFAVVAGNVDMSLAGGKDDPKYTIKEVMQEAHKKGLLTKVYKGDASDAEAKRLLELYTELAKQKPPAGDADAFKATTKKMVEGAKLIVDGKKDDGIALLKKTVQCMKCHMNFKG